MSPYMILHTAQAPNCFLGQHHPHLDILLLGDLQLLAEYVGDLDVAFVAVHVQDPRSDDDFRYKY
jgi:hypothetical protein